MNQLICFFNSFNNFDYYHFFINYYHPEKYISFNTIYDYNFLNSQIQYNFITLSILKILINNKINNYFKKIILKNKLIFLNFDLIKSLPLNLFKLYFKYKPICSFNIFFIVKINKFLKKKYIFINYLLFYSKNKLLYFFLLINKSFNNNFIIYNKNYNVLNDIFNNILIFKFKMIKKINNYFQNKQLLKKYFLNFIKNNNIKLYINIDKINNFFKFIYTYYKIGNIFIYNSLINKKFDNCSICLNNFNNNKSFIIITNKCNHYFHYNCIIKDFNFKKINFYNCPYCKSSTTINNINLNFLANSINSFLNLF